MAASNKAATASKPVHASVPTPPCHSQTQGNSASNSKTPPTMRKWRRGRAPVS